MKLWLNGHSMRAVEAPVEVVTETGLPLRIDVLSEQQLPLFRAEGRSEISDLPLGEIIAFLHNVGQNWKRRNYTYREIYQRDLTRYVGFSPRAASAEADWIALLLSASHQLYDLVDAELGNWRVLDEWIHRGEAMVRAFARGTVFHLAPGNVPVSSVISLIRAVLTKNTSILKFSAADPFTPTALVQSFADVDPDHPVTRSINLVYWPSDAADGVGSQLAAQADAVVAWGGEAAVRWAAATAASGNGAELMVFGPKRSFAVVGPDADPMIAAERVATDVAFYDQQACFSTRKVFVHEAVADGFCAALDSAFHRLETILPPSVASIDKVADRSLQRAHARFLGGEIATSGDNKWSILLDVAGAPYAHPLGRTLYVERFTDCETVFAAAGPDVQTVAVYPWDYGLTLRDALGQRGVSRIVECGMSNIFRVGGGHDGLAPLQRLVRTVANELPGKERIRGISLPIDQAEFLENDRFPEYCP